jgi:hypothetical protein
MVCGGVDVAAWRSFAAGPVARIERSEIRELAVNAAKPPRVSLALNPGYSLELVDRLSLPASGEREKKSPPC